MNEAEASITCPNVQLTKKEEYRLSFKFSIESPSNCEVENTCNENFEWQTKVTLGEVYSFSLTNIGERMLAKKTYDVSVPSNEVFQSSFYPITGVPTYKYDNALPEILGSNFGEVV